MKLEDFKNITQFLRDNDNFRFEVGQVGFGRPCVGIVEKGADSYVSYRIYDDKYETTSDCSAAWGADRPDKAYHKHDCLAVLMPTADFDLGPSDAEKAEAVAALDKWLGAIIYAGYKQQKYDAGPHAIQAILGNLTARQLTAIVDK